MTDDPNVEPSAQRQRTRLLLNLERILELPMVILSIVWLILLIVELVYGVSTFARRASTFIWILFICDFVLRFVVAPAKLLFLRKNVLTVVSLALPALRIFRALRALRVLRLARGARGLNLVRVLTTANRGMRALGASFGRRGFGYVLALTVAVTFLGAAGMYAFEHEFATPGQGMMDFGTALWWTAMIMTTMGSEYWPATVEGRILCLVLALYAFTIFGYVTATLSSYFIGRDAENPQAELAGHGSVPALSREVRQLRKELFLMRAELAAHRSGSTVRGDETDPGTG